MTQSGARQAIITSALVVGGVYAYRRFSGETATDGKKTKNALGLGGQLLSTSKFVTGWGFAFLMCAILAEMSPGFGGGFAILIGAADFLTNMPAIQKDVYTGLLDKNAYSKSSFGNPGQTPQQNSDAIVKALNQAPGATPVRGSVSAITPEPPSSFTPESVIPYIRGGFGGGGGF